MVLRENEIFVLISLYIDKLKPDVVLIASMGADKKRKILTQAKN